MRNGPWDEDNVEHTEEGPFVSFTDLLAGVLFIFLILIAYFLTLHRGEIETSAEKIKTQIQTAVAASDQKANDVLSENASLAQANKSLSDQLESLKIEQVSHAQQAASVQSHSADADKLKLLSDQAARTNMAMTELKTQLELAKDENTMLKAEAGVYKNKADIAGKDASAVSAMKAQLDKTRSDNEALRTQLTAAQNSKAGGGLDFHKAMVFNYFEGNSENDRNLNYTQTSILYIANNGSDFISYHVWDFGNYAGKKSAMTHMPTIADVNARTCRGNVFSHDRIHVDCATGLGNTRMLLEFRRTSGDRYQGTVSGVTGGTMVTHDAILQILEIDDERLR